MKILKNMSVALILGILYVGIGLIKLDTVNLSKIIFSNTMDGIEFYPQYISVFSFQYIPIFAFQILFCTYIYKHFCSASIYFFSRNANRIYWYLKEVAKMYVSTIIFLITMCMSEIIFIRVFTTVNLDRGAIIMAVYYIAIYSLYLLATTLAINIMSILFGSNIGFTIVQAVILLSISIFFILGNYSKDGLITGKMVAVIKSNPIANLIFSFHSSKIDTLNSLINTKNINFDLNYSVLYYLILCVAIIIFGIFVVEKHEFVINNKEME